MSNDIALETVTAVVDRICHPHIQRIEAQAAGLEATYNQRYKAAEAAVLAAEARHASWQTGRRASTKAALEAAKMALKAVTEAPYWARSTEVYTLTPREWADIRAAVRAGGEFVPYMWTLEQAQGRVVWGAYGAYAALTCEGDW